MKSIKLTILLFVIGLSGLHAQDCRNMTLTSRLYPETANLNMAVAKELGRDFSVADWNDLKLIPNIEAWIMCMHLQREQSFFVTRGGDFTYSGKKQYIAQYFPSGKVPSNFLIHDKIGNKLFLGSWYGVRMSILAVRHGGPANDVRRNDGPEYDGRRVEGRRNDIVDYGFLKMTNRTFSEKQNLREEARREFNGKCEIADWADLKGLPNIEAWISRVNIHGGQTFFVTLNGSLTLGRERQYYVLYSPSGRLPSGFVAHDQIHNKLFLGSWYGERRQILVKEFRNR